jgi:two-component system chemotaxis response regulator CheY
MGTCLATGWQTTGVDGRPVALVVDDMDVMRKLIGHFLGKAGFAVIEAENGRDALEQAKGRDLRLVITDLQMPVIDGYEFIRAFRADPERRFVPVVLLTTDLGPGTLERARAAGATGCIAKPFQPKKLMTLVQRFCGE